MVNCNILVSHLQQTPVFCHFCFISSSSPPSSLLLMLLTLFKKKKASLPSCTGSHLGTITIGVVQKELKMS